MAQQSVLLLGCLLWSTMANKTEVKEVLQVKNWVPYFDYTGNFRVTGGVFQVGMGDSWPRIAMEWDSMVGMDYFCNKSVFYEEGGATRRPQYQRAGGSLGKAPYVNGCGIHVHAGTSCEKAAGGHYYNATGIQERQGFFSPSVPDPWTDVVYFLPGNGEAEIHTGFDELEDFVNHTVIIHGFYGEKIACGLLERYSHDNVTGVVHEPDKTNSNLLWIGVAALVVALLCTFIAIYTICCNKRKGRATEVDYKEDAGDDWDEDDIE